MLLSSFLIHLLSLHALLPFSHLYFSTCTFVYFDIRIFLYFHVFIIVFFHILIHFCCLYFLYFLFYFSMICWVIMCYCTCDWMSVCDCMSMYVWYVSMLAYFPTYCGEYLMRGRGCLLNGQHLIPWARVYRVGVIWNIL